MLKKLCAAAGFVLVSLPVYAQYIHYNYWVSPNGVITYQPGPGTAQTRRVVPHPHSHLHPHSHWSNQQTPLVLQPNQRIVCNRNYQVHSSSRGVYEVKQDCWIQQQ